MRAAAQTLLLVLAFSSRYVTSQDTTHGKNVGCYWGVWSFYRPDVGFFDVDDIDPSLCTHGYYGFADMHNDTFTLKIIDPWYDQAEDDCDVGLCHYDGYRRFIALKEQEPNFVPMISIGGWNAGSGAYSIMAADQDKRTTFIDSVMDFLEVYHFDGVDLDWEYPGSREGSDPEHDKENFNLLVKEFSDRLKAKNKLFSAALSPGYKTIDIAYDIPYIVKYFDWINVMTYDYHGWFEGHNYTGHNNPLYRRQEEHVEGHPGYLFNVWDTIKVYLEKGAPKEKLVMGIPAYGRGFHLVSNEENGLYCPADDGIPAGPYTLQKGFLGYLEIMQAQFNDTFPTLPEATPGQWTIVTDDCYQAPYMYNNPYWVGYEDIDSTVTKMKALVNFLDLGGAFIWSIDTDDFRGIYHENKFPLLHAIHDTIASGETIDPEDPKCSGTAPMCDLFDTPTTTIATTTTADPTTTMPMTTTTSDNNPGGCEHAYDNIPHPVDCHQYYMCMPDGNGGFYLEEHTCGDWVFDPNDDGCKPPELPGNENLCP